MRASAWRRPAGVATLVVAGLAVGYIVLLAHPEPLFTHVHERAGIRVYSRVPLDSRIDEALDSAANRLAAAPLRQRGSTHRVFVAGGKRIYAFFTGPGRRAMAKNFELGNSIFIPDIDLATLQVTHFDGRRESLAAIVTHEAAHTDLQRAAGGVLRLWRLPFWKKEGYSEYVSYADHLQTDDALRLLRASDGRSVERHPGEAIPASYFQAELMWGYLLQERSMNVGQILAMRVDPADLMSEIGRWAARRE